MTDATVTTTLLIVDDEEEIRTMLSRHFRLMGYQVTLAESGAVALDRLSERRYDVVVSDIMMPGMLGTELLAVIRDEYPMTRVIMITGHVTLENALACMRRGADTCVFKPLIDLSELDNAVVEAVQSLRRWQRKLATLQSGRRSIIPR